LERRLKNHSTTSPALKRLKSRFGFQGYFEKKGEVHELRQLLRGGSNSRRKPTSGCSKDGGCVAKDGESFLSPVSKNHKNQITPSWGHMTWKHLIY